MTRLECFTVLIEREEKKERKRLDIEERKERDGRKSTAYR
jgi:hypothetical protein